MKLSELIEDAEKVLKEHGDIPVVVRDPGCGCCAAGTYEEAATEIDAQEPRVWTETAGTNPVPVAYVVM
ncbi:hypothetical protein U5640_16655 [Streptomyces sp. SS7]|uniref:hypothetical protein n=1 Tax=Streptomyces sp. SS7 TaxID=3108485 RepID=UPI0030ED3C61